MATYPAIGSSEWLTQQADKLINFGLDALLHKGPQKPITSNVQSETTTMGDFSNKLPWILGGIAVVGIGLILWKR